MLTRLAEFLTCYSISTKLACVYCACAMPCLMHKLYYAKMSFSARLLLVQSIFADGTDNSEVQNLVVTHPLVPDRSVYVHSLCQD